MKIYEASEVGLVNELKNLITIWVKDFQFSSSNPSGVETTPKVHKYDLPIRKPPMNQAVRNEIDRPIPPPDIDSEYPAIIIRPEDGSDNADTDNNYYYAETKIKIIVAVSEYDLERGIDYCLSAMQIIRQQLLRIANSLYAEEYILQTPLEWAMLDTAQAPQFENVLTTTWRYMLPSPNTNLNDPKYF